MRTTTKATDIKVGDLVNFDGQIMSHRIASIDVNNGGTLFVFYTTRGTRFILRPTHTATVITY